jgi:flagellar hook-basal body complex protein FliE
MSITPIPTALPLTSITPAGLNAGQTNGPVDKAGDSFGDLVGKAVEQLDQMQQQADTASVQVATGGDIELHTAMVTMEESSLAMQLALQVRNKVVDSYQEIMRMQV